MPDEPGVRTHRLRGLDFSDRVVGTSIGHDEDLEPRNELPKCRFGFLDPPANNRSLVEGGDDQRQAVGRFARIPDACLPALA